MNSITSYLSLLTSYFFPYLVFTINCVYLHRKKRKEEGFLIPLFVFKSKFMSDIAEKIRNWVLEYIGEGPIFLVDFQFVPGVKRTLLTILVDTLDGVSIDECALLSRKLAHFIEENELIPDAFNLEVSSPGLDFPLTQGWQFQKNAGRLVKIWLKKEGVVEGTLLSHTAESIEVLTEKTVKHRKVIAKESSQFMLTDVDKIKVQVSF
jgi:ribosome maturation factor RimP